MSRLTLFLLSCLMTLSILTRTSAMFPDKPIVSVLHPDEQCRLKHQEAACYGLAHKGDTIDCMNLKCVVKGSKPFKGKHLSVSIGKAADGSHCGVSKFCLNGVCSEKPKNHPMPRQEHQQSSRYDCY